MLLNCIERHARVRILLAMTRVRTEATPSTSVIDYCLSATNLQMVAPAVKQRRENLNSPQYKWRRADGTADRGDVCPLADVQEICLETPYWLSGRPGWSVVHCVQSARSCAKFCNRSTLPRVILPLSPQPIVLSLPIFRSPPPPTPPPPCSFLPPAEPTLVFSSFCARSLQPQPLHRSPLRLQLISLVLGRPFSNFEFLR